MTVCDRGRGPEACDVTILKFYILHIKPGIESDALFSVLMDVFSQRQGRPVGALGDA